MLVDFRERLGVDVINRINEKTFKKTREKAEEEAEKKTESLSKEKPVENRGKLIIDATPAPADISYPTDLNLLNQARIVTEKIRDILYKQLPGKLNKKPITHRRTARKEYLTVAKKRRATRKEIKKSIKKQLKYVSKNLSSIDQLIEKGASLTTLSKRQYKMVLVVRVVYRQQPWMFDNNKIRIEERIVSLNQPHVRPIVRGRRGQKYRIWS